MLRFIGINFHRRCFVADIHTDCKGKQCKVYHYENMMTACDKLDSRLNANGNLKPGISFEILGRLIDRISDKQAADRLQKARRKLFQTIQ